MQEQVSVSAPSEPVEELALVLDNGRAPAWARFTDALLDRAVSVVAAPERRSDPLAGLRIAEEDAAALLDELRTGEPAAAADDELSATRSRLHAELVTGDDFSDLVAGAGLDRVETEVLAVLAALELDPTRARLVAYLNDDVTQRRATPATLRRLFPGEPDVVLAVGPGGGLRRAALLVPTADEPSWSETPLRLHPSVLWWLAGDRAADPGLPAGAEVLEVARAGGARLVVVAGADRIRRLQAAVDAMSAPGFLLTPLPTSAESWDAVVRYATLAGLGVVVELADALPPDARERIDRTHHLSWGLTSEGDLPLASLPRRPWLAVAPAAPEATEEETRDVLGGAPPPGVRLSAAQLDAVGAALPALGGDIGAAVRRLAAGRIAKLADRITPTRTWDDLVLPAHLLEQVQHVAVRARRRDRVFDDWGFDANPSTGVVAIFSGPSGTGKTMAAEIVAGDLGLDLYRLDLSRLVDKYIGETEKNLAEAFAAAEASPVVLFFDEADAILGKRSEVSDAHDRYANIEVAYLLQRIERFDGVVILASNLAKNLDPAFLRRIHVSVEFPMPAPPERREIWARSIPPAAPTTDLDLDFLAERFEMSGGSIRNAAVTAAFLAAEAGTGLTMEVATSAVARELLKQARLVRAEDFGPWAPGGAARG